MSDVVMTIAGDTAHAAATFGFATRPRGSLRRGAECTRSQLDSAFESAARPTGLEVRRGVPTHDAARMADVLMASAGELAPVLTAEQGKPLADANVEVFAAAIWCQYFANLETPSQIIQDDESALVEVVRRRSVSSPPSRRGTSRSRSPSGRSPRVARRQHARDQALAVHALSTLKAVELLRDAVPPGDQCGQRWDELGAWMTSHPTPRK